MSRPGLLDQQEMYLTVDESVQMIRAISVIKSRRDRNRISRELVSRFIMLRFYQRYDAIEKRLKESVTVRKKKEITWTC